MGVHVINNKKIDMTEDEWSMYQKIVQSYTTSTNKGEDLFINLFETDNDGIIVFLKPPSTHRTSFEVFLFLMSIMQHQHLRQMRSEHDDAMKQLKSKADELDKIIATAKEKMQDK